MSWKYTFSFSPSSGVIAPSSINGCGQWTGWRLGVSVIMESLPAFPWPYSSGIDSVQFSSVQSLSRVRLFPTPWTAARQASLSITNSWSLPKPMSIESVMPSNRLILCHPLLLLPSIFPIIRVFSRELALHIRWPKYWSFSFSISPSNEHPGWSPSGWTGGIN